MIAYLIYTVGITAFIYPVAVHWVWHEEGWLCAWNKSAIFGLGMIDFAGSGLVHMMGGLAGMVGSIVCGPRQGAFDKPKAPKFQGHSAVLVSLGTWCLWFGCFGFITHTQANSVLAGDKNECRQRNSPCCNRHHTDGLCC